MTYMDRAGRRIAEWRSEYHRTEKSEWRVSPDVFEALKKEALTTEGDLWPEPKNILFGRPFRVDETLPRRSFILVPR